MSETQDAAKRIYNEVNTAIEAALTKTAQRFNADDWDPFVSPDHEYGHEPEGINE